MINDIESTLASEQEISDMCDRIADQINKDYANSGRQLVLICILKGSLMFASELMKRITLPIEIDFMKVSSYGSGTSSTGVINIHLDIKRTDVSNVDFIIVEDIIDSGRTLSHLIKYFTEKGARSVRTATLLDKPSRRTVEFVPDYCGMTIPDKFVVGFGLDYNEKYRNLPFVGILSPKVYSK
jgi:hypoxanthine phosphoribosyltransferase